MEEKYLNTIANLTLSGNNGSLSNKSFLEKKNMNRDGREQGYAFSRLWLNQYLREIHEWNIENLNVRYKLLLERFFEIWTYPNVEVDDEFDTDEDYTIYNAPDPKYKKLDYFIFKDEKVVTGEVATMYYHVIKALFDENPSAFYHQDIKNLLGLTTNAQELRSAYPISPTYYIETNIDNVSKFRRLKALLTKFDYEEELLINFSNYEPEELPAENIDREYWLRKGNVEAMRIVEECQSILAKIDNGLKINYTLYYIGLSKESKSKNFVLLFPKKGFVRVAIMVNNVENWIEQLKANDIEFLSVSKRNGRLKFRISAKNLSKQSAFLEQIFRSSYESWMS